MDENNTNENKGKTLKEEWEEAKAREEIEAKERDVVWKKRKEKEEKWSKKSSIGDFFDWLILEVGLGFVKIVLILLVVFLSLDVLCPGLGRSTMYFSSIEYLDEEDASITVIQQGFFDRYSVQTFYLDFEDKDWDGELDCNELETARIGEIGEKYETTGEYLDGKLMILLETTDEMWEDAEGVRERGFFTMGLGFKSFGKFYKKGDVPKWDWFELKPKYRLGY